MRAVRAGLLPGVSSGVSSGSPERPHQASSGRPADPLQAPPILPLCAIHTYVAKVFVDNFFNREDFV